MPLPDPPPARRDPVVAVLHGVEVADPYRWLEDGGSDEVAAWVAAQNGRTRDVLDRRADRPTWHARLVELLQVPVVLAVQVRGDVLVSLERPTGADQAHLVARRLDRPGSEALVLVDPAAGSHDGATAIDWFESSDDGALVAVGVSEGGTEDSVLRVVRTSTAELLDDEIPRTRACSVGWEPDGSGFVYTRYPDGDQYHRTVHVHRLGDDWERDPVVWADHPTPETWPSVEVSPDGRYVLVTAMVGWSRYDLHLLDRSTGAWHAVVDGVDAMTSLTFGADALYGTTMIDAPRGRLVRVPLDPPPSGPDGWRTIVPERDVVLGAVVVEHEGLLVSATRRSVDVLERWSFDGSTGGPVGDIGVVAVAGLTADRHTGRSFAILTGFDRPPSLVDLAAGAALTATVPDELHIPRLVVDEIDVTSPDGTVVGAFVVRSADTVVGPDTPTILTGYGGFAISETPVWSPMAAAWCEAGGQWVLAGLRGGFEHGESWHLAGNRANKQRVFDDFHAVADHLVAAGSTSRARLAVAGGSNGGLLVGAALTQRPDLCRAVWCAVPLLDMVRFPQFLIARLWTDEYGDPDVAEEFGWLHAYSPYHRVVEGTGYPAVLLTTAEGDTRVDPLHARKMAAMLQWAAADQRDRPVLLLQEGRAGHGAGKPVSKKASEGADVLAFLAWQLGVSR
jgi:prolyl oligopeptidase